MNEKSKTEKVKLLRQHFFSNKICRLPMLFSPLIFWDQKYDNPKEDAGNDRKIKNKTFLAIQEMAPKVRAGEKI